MAVPQIDAKSITDEKKFLVDNGQCLAKARSGQGGSNLTKDTALCAGVGAGLRRCSRSNDRREGYRRSCWWLSGGSRSVYRGEQINDQIYSNCIIERGYTIWERD